MPTHALSTTRRLSGLACNHVLKHQPCWMKKKCWTQQVSLHTKMFFFEHDETEDNAVILTVRKTFQIVGDLCRHTCTLTTRATSQIVRGSMPTFAYFDNTPGLQILWWQLRAPSVRTEASVWHEQTSLFEKDHLSVIWIISRRYIVDHRCMTILHYAFKTFSNWGLRSNWGRPQLPSEDLQLWMHVDIRVFTYTNNFSVSQDLCQLTWTLTARTTSQIAGNCQHGARTNAQV